MKKFLIGVGVFLLALTMPDIQAFAAEVETETTQSMEAEALKNALEYADATEYTSGDYKYIFNEDGTVMITEYIGSSSVYISIPDTLDGYTVTGIGGGVFLYTYAELLEIPASITYIEEGGFFADEIIIADGNTKYKIVNDSLMTMDGTLVLYCFSTAENYTIPDGVTCIGKQAFYDSDIINVSVPDSVKIIGIHAFNNASIESIDLGNGVTEIKGSAFMYSNLKSVIIPDNVVTIGSNAFYSNYHLETVVIGNGVKTIGDGAFEACPELISINIPDSVVSIGYSAFRDNDKIECYTIPKSVEHIDDWAFTECNSLKEIIVEEGNAHYKVVDDALLTIDGTEMLAYTLGNPRIDYTVPDGVKTLGSFVFADSMNLMNVKLPESVTKFNQGVFRQCDMLEGVVISGSIEIISQDTFRYCDKLKSVYIPSSVKEIDLAAFDRCYALEIVNFVGTEEEWNAIDKTLYNDVLNNVTVYYMANLRFFVERMYTVALGREADSYGLNMWVQMLVEETHDGAGLAKEFVLGEEFALRNLSNEEYVDVLYATFFNREADEAGKAHWVATLEAGQSREYVLAQFVNLGEFTLLCAEYGINRGVMFDDGNVAATGLVKFVQRLYRLVLGRESEDEGLRTWTTALYVKSENAMTAATKFFNSEEYALKATDNSTYVTDLYGVFMDREPDADGLAFWVSCIEEQGVSRDWVLSEFAKSEEFKIIAAGYGLE